MLVIRQAKAEDSDFLTEMLAVAVDWRADSPRSATEVMRDPALAHYVAGWPREGEFGLVAEDPVPLGAAWWRCFTEDDPGFGYVDSATPEISIGVVKNARGHGIGRRLLSALIDQAREQAMPALCLSVEPDNDASDLYRALGFQEVGSVGGAVTMLLRL